MEIQKGEYLPVSDVEQLREIMATFYSRPAFATNSGIHAIYTVPYHDGFGFGTYNLRLTLEFSDKAINKKLIDRNRIIFFKSKKF